MFSCPIDLQKKTSLHGMYCLHSAWKMPKRKLYMPANVICIWQSTLSSSLKRLWIRNATLFWIKKFAWKAQRCCRGHITLHQKHNIPCIVLRTINPQTAFEYFLIFINGFIPLDIVPFDYSIKWSFTCKLFLLVYFVF